MGVSEIRVVHASGDGFARGSGRLRVKALAPNDAALRDEEVAEGSPGLVVLAAKISGTYRILVQRLAAEGEQRYEIRLEELLSRQSYEQRDCENRCQWSYMHCPSRSHLPLSQLDDVTR